VLVLDQAGWHTSVHLRVRDQVHRLFLPSYSPELQPAEHLLGTGPLTNTARINRHFADLDDLEDAQARRCVALQRGRIRCGHCGGKMCSTWRANREPWVYLCRQERLGPDSGILRCPASGQSITAAAVDLPGWADVLDWLSNPENVDRLLTDWHTDNRSTERSMTSRLDAAVATIANLRDKMARLADTIAETDERESRRTLQEKLDAYGAQATKEEKKRTQLLQKARDAALEEQADREMREWVRVVVERAPTFTREEQIYTLKALGAVATVWREDYVHPDGWPQRYQIKLPFTGFSGRAEILPPLHDTAN
jgi:hypothetical protein